jgi:hypothetical protein
MVLSWLEGDFQYPTSCTGKTLVTPIPWAGPKYMRREFDWVFRIMYNLQRFLLFRNAREAEWCEKMRVQTSVENPSVSFNRGRGPLIQFVGLVGHL